VLKAVWQGEDTAFEGRHFSARGVRFHPVPLSSLTVWIGGNSRSAIRRAVSRAQGWAPFATSGYARASRTTAIDSDEELVTRIAMARAMAEDVERTESLDICYSAGDLGDTACSLDERQDRLGRLVEAGVTWFPISIPGANRAEVVEGLQRFADDMIAPTA
jgi:alkanesulfonate monooxygenase SsuD/methylene tetrahydromethanopterin reductase-like flavin-dependent oxidoreductase (luciferase family)